MSTKSDRKRKLLFMTHAGNPGGAELKSIYLCKHINDECTFVYLSSGMIGNLLKDYGISYHYQPLPKELMAFRREDGIKNLLKLVPATMSTLHGIIRLCRQYEAIICVSQKAFILAALAKPFARRPVIWLMNDIMSPEHFSKPVIFLLTKIFRLAPECIIVNSRASYQAWVEAGGRADNVHIVYPGTDFETIEAVLDDQDAIKAFREKYTSPGKPLMGVFGRISPWKGQHVFLKAMKRLTDVNGILVGGVQFGEEDYKAELEALVTDLDLQDRVTFVGHMDDVTIAMAACDIIVHCSTSEEPFGLVIVEGMAVKKPVIASNGGGAREIISSPDYGKLTPLGDDKALAMAIKDYLENKPVAEKIAYAGYEHAKDNFSSNAMVDKFITVLNGTLR